MRGEVTVTSRQCLCASINGICDPIGCPIIEQSVA
jgi:hypothetical protein